MQQLVKRKGSVKGIDNEEVIPDDAPTPRAELDQHYLTDGDNEPQPSNLSVDLDTSLTEKCNNAEPEGGATIPTALGDHESNHEVHVAVDEGNAVDDADVDDDDDEKTEPFAASSPFSDVTAVTTETPCWLKEGPLRAIYLPVAQELLNEAVERTRGWSVTHLMALHSDLSANTQRMSFSAFLDPQELKSAARNKVDGQVLCWLCTYNYKVAKSKQRHEKRHEKRHSKRSNLGESTSRTHDSLGSSKRQRTEEIPSRTSLDRSASVLTDGLGSAYSDQMVTISQLQDEMRNLKRTLAQRDSELLAKDRVIAGLRADLGDLEAQRREREYRSQVLAEEEIEKLKKAEILASRNLAVKRRRAMNADGLSPLKLSPLRLPPKLSTSASTPHLTPVLASKEKSKTPLSTPKKEPITPSKSPKQEEVSTEATESKKVTCSPSKSPREVGLESAPHSDKVKSDHGNGNGEAGKRDDQLNASNPDGGEENLKC
ncbi:unnamed protein product [Rodentolepis nana]|uniref:Uncharacterized protein n=1 Tax=Rodentolepis nana TaxID=102285 RepID=A0A3P7S6K9_RODNA|nr:unnamed protein product [Rodentolepis nana]